MPTLTALFGLLRSALADRQRLLLENAALRHQVAVLKRGAGRPRIDDSEPRARGSRKTSASTVSSPT